MSPQQRGIKISCTKIIPYSNRVIKELKFAFEHYHKYIIILSSLLRVNGVNYKNVNDDVYHSQEIH